MPPTGIAVPLRIPPALARVRRRWDRAALAGAQPHVTVLYPFADAADLAPVDRAALAGIAARILPFDVRFEAVRRFEDGVVWVEPSLGDPFRALTAAVVERWPAYPPYDGLFDEVIPHLTVVESDTADLLPVEAAARAAVPFTARAARLEVWRQDAAGRWRPHWRLPLGATPPRR